MRRGLADRSDLGPSRHRCRAGSGEGPAGGRRGRRAGLSRWEVRRRLGTGSTSRAFLVRDLRADPAVRGARALAVLKVALSDSRGEVLAREAEVMGRLRPDSRIIRLVEPEPLTIGGRTVLILEYVGDERDPDENAEASSGTRRREETVARQLRESGLLQIDQLEAYGDYLFGAVDFLEGEGVWHRDIKPDNIAIRVRPNRTRELVLIDFSLAGYPVQETDAGTDGYLDPFTGTLTRSVYDAHAERYAVAVTLHEMASGELPKWGDGKVSPRQTDPEKWSYPTIAADAFDPAIRDGLVAFFRKALHRDAAQRFRDLKPMRDAWKKIFLDLAETAPSGPRGSRHPAPTVEAEPTSAVIAAVEPESAEQQRDRLAAEVTRETHLSASGLSPAAESFLYGLGVTTVGELLDYSQRNLVNAPPAWVPRRATRSSAASASGASACVRHPFPRSRRRAAVPPKRNCSGSAPLSPPWWTPSPPARARVTSHSVPCALSASTPSPRCWSRSLRRTGRTRTRPRWCGCFCACPTSEANYQASASGRSSGRWPTPSVSAMDAFRRC
ncbi:hypothetical protein ACFSTC_37480 [Nonomuraea ferruginea]